MAINKKLIHFKTMDNFNTQLSLGNILDTSICFIKDAKKIWTHGQFYDGDVQSVINDLNELNDKFEELGSSLSGISDLTTIRNNALSGKTAYGWGNHADAGYVTEENLDYEVSSLNYVKSSSLTAYTKTTDLTNTLKSYAKDAELQNLKGDVNSVSGIAYGHITEISGLKGRLSELEDNELVYSAALTELDEHKVDKVNGKGLSTNDFTNAYKNLLDNLDDISSKDVTSSITSDDNAVPTSKAVKTYVDTKVAELETLINSFVTLLNTPT